MMHFLEHDIHAFCKLSIFGCSRGASCCSFLESIAWSINRATAELGEVERPLHYGLTEGWVQKFKASYLL